MPKSIIDNPYSSVPEDQITRIQAFVATDDYKIVRRSADGEGFLMSVTATLWHKLVNRLKSYGIEDYSRHDDFVDFINNIEIIYTGNNPSVLGGNGGTVDRVDTKAVAPNEQGRIEGIRSETTGTPSIVSSAERGDSTVKGSKGRTKGSKTA